MAVYPISDVTSVRSAAAARKTTTSIFTTTPTRTCANIGRAVSANQFHRKKSLPGIAIDSFRNTRRIRTNEFNEEHRELARRSAADHPCNLKLQLAIYTTHTYHADS